MANEILDLDELIPDRKMAKVTDRNGKAHSVDVGFVNLSTVKVVVRNQKLLADLAENSGAPTEEKLDAMYDVISSVCQASDPELSRAFLEENFHIIALIELSKRVMEAVNDYFLANPAGAGGREKPGQSGSAG